MGRGLLFGSLFMRTATVRWSDASGRRLWQYIAADIQGTDPI